MFFFILISLTYDGINSTFIFGDLDKLAQFFLCARCGIEHRAFNFWSCRCYQVSSGTSHQLPPGNCAANSVLDKSCWRAPFQHVAHLRGTIVNPADFRFGKMHLAILFLRIFQSAKLITFIIRFN